MRFLEWLQTTALGKMVAESVWGYPLFETLHTLGMAMLVGALGLINLRVLGYKLELPILGTRDLLPLAWLGFTINLISGIALFASDAVYFWSSYTFRVKMLLIALGGINAFVLGRAAFREAQAGGSGFIATAGIRWVAGSALVFWLGAIIAGRLIAYAP
jgi:hypothetical protein